MSCEMYKVANNLTHVGEVCSQATIVISWLWRSLSDGKAVCPLEFDARGCVVPLLLFFGFLFPATCLRRYPSSSSFIILSLDPESVWSLLQCMYIHIRTGCGMVGWFGFLLIVHTPYISTNIIRTKLQRPKRLKTQTKSENSIIPFYVVSINSFPCETINRSHTLTPHHTTPHYTVSSLLFTHTHTSNVDR